MTMNKKIQEERKVGETKIRKEKYVRGKQIMKKKVGLKVTEKIMRQESL